jgi:hypothetical protein
MTRIRFAAGDAVGGPTPQTLIWLAVVMACLHGRAAQAAEWRYCLALSPTQRTVYISAPFATDVAMETIEAEFGAALDRASVAHDAVQCPRGEAETVAAMKVQSIQYNQANGNKVVQMNWRP